MLGTVVNDYAVQPPLWQGKQASVSPTLGGNAGAQGITGLVAIGKEQPPR